MDSLFKFITKGDLTYLVFTPWEQDERMIHCFTTRYGGVSEGDLTSLNLGFNRGDEKERVVENYRRVCKALDVEPESIVISKQVHETHIAKVTKAHRGNGLTRPNEWESVDGIYTNCKDVTLVTHYADCVPLFFYAPEYGMIGMAHAGWRGTVQKIGEKMLETWYKEEGIPKDKVQVAIGPSIGACHFEVGDEVVKAFKEAFEETDFISYNETTHKAHIDLWACNKQVLMEAGMLEEHIIVAEICTCCQDQVFFSHRKSAGKRGTLGAFMALK